MVMDCVWQNLCHPIQVVHPLYLSCALQFVKSCHSMLNTSPLIERHERQLSQFSVYGPRQMRAEALRDLYFVLNNDQETAESSDVSVVSLLLR
jgi:hypothetical protein